jgi:hypothetical protein
MVHLMEVRSNIMEADFVNEYINRLTVNLHDAVSKNVLHETRMALLEKNYAILQTEHQQTLQELERLKKKPSKQNLDSSGF